ncbi:MAG: cobalamin synthesis protein P47K [Candidatus Bathyarchaeota archaeon B24]|nr:MAG: cobalamin synthesis protein P47K [Candidatus Bathyarchaeota archaeon B24]
MFNLFDLKNKELTSLMLPWRLEVLVDSLTVKDYGFEAKEVIRGCFCCNFQVFLSRAREVLKKLKPDVILAEPVGSCAGMMATLYMPLREFYGEEFEIAGRTA